MNPDKTDPDEGRWNISACSPSAQPWLLCAAWLAPMSGPLRRDAAVLIGGGTILDFGSRDNLVSRHPDVPRVELGNAIVLPGLINAHTHLELSLIPRGQAKPENLAAWILQLMSQTAPPGASAAALVERAVREGVRQCLRFGITTVGDISKQCMFSRPVLREGPLRIISYGEIQAMAQRRGLLEERFAAAADLSQESDRLRIGLTPHAPYTVEPAGYRRCLDFARAQGRPLATHLAETLDEAPFLANHSGPFRKLWEAITPQWDPMVPKFPGGPIRLARDLGLLDYPTLLAHVNYCDDQELDILSAGQASVVFCPRTHQYFGHSPHRWREMLGRGINVAVGTDSCASSPDLNLVDDLRLLHQIAPEMKPEHLWELATTRAARALGMEKFAGPIAKNRDADLVAFEVQTDDPLREILETDRLPSGMWIKGERRKTGAEI